MAAMKTEWSLGRQSALWFGGLLAVLTVILVGFVYAMTLHQVASKLDEEVREIAELTADKLDGLDTEQSRAVLELLVEENQQLDVLIELHAGDVDTLVGEEALRVAGDAQFERRLEVSIADGRSLTVVIDGRNWEEQLSEFSSSIALLVFAFAVVLLFASMLFGRKVSALLRSVSRSVEESGRPSIPQGAPREIADVTRAVSAEFDKLETARARIQLLIAGAAHELRSPVQSLLSNVQLSIRRTPDPEQLPDILADQEQELVDLARKVDNLVLLSSEAEDRLPMESFDWATELDLRLGSDVRRARRHDVEVEFLGPESLLIEGNRESLMLAVRNLVSNAVRFSEPGQRVHVTSALRDDGFVTVTVDDQGPGVAEEEREQVFETLRRGQQRQRGGYGLGLALVRRAMLDHDGGVRVEDSPMGGARFVLEFPSCAKGAVSWW